MLRHGLLALLLAGLLMPGSTAAGSSSAEQRLATFEAERPAIAAALAATIATCVARHDTDHPAFHGCIDWHSAVHGSWALTAYRLATGDKQYEALVEASLAPALVAREREYLAADPAFEMPYGRAWFLRLALEHRRAKPNMALDTMADEVAESLIAYYRAIPPDPGSIAYNSATWALINLHAYGRARGNAQIVVFVDEQVREHYLFNGRCPVLRREVETGEFMALCTNWAWLVSEVLPRDEFRNWLAAFLPPEALPAPIAESASVHQAGLNFSRCWGLWQIYRATGDSRYADAFQAHFHATYSRPEQWNGRYETVAHWVPQFGMLALALSDKPPR